MNGLDAMAKRLYNMTTSEAHACRLCVRCKREVQPLYWTPIDRAEYRLSALCPACYDTILPEEDECD